MKISAFLLFCCLVNIYAAPTYSQTTKISLNLKDATIEDVLNKIEDVSEFYFLYNNKLIDVTRKVDVEADKEPIKDILNDILPSDTKFIVYDRQIILTPSDGTPLSAVLQQQKISGTVTDEKGNPLPGVTVLLKGTTLGSLTDASGKYVLDNPPKNPTLIFSFVGMSTQEIPSNGQMLIDVVLKEAAIGLNEVVVVGYGTQKKVTATGSIVSSRGDELKKSPATNLANNLIGRMPGLTVVSRSSEPGNDNVIVRIRGSNTLGDNNPLIVVDGVANRDMQRINPNDVENITILKDASAAIYGSEAANGVILVTTKRGSIGKPKMSFSMNSGVTQPTVIPKMANAAQYATILNELAYYTDPALGRNQSYSVDDIQKFSDGSDPWGHPNTDWYGEVFKTWSGQNRENFSISGGTDNIKYFLSLGALFEDGVYKNSGTNYKQYDFRTNLDGKVTKNIRFAFDVSGRQEMRNLPVNAGGSGTLDNLKLFKPTMVAYWPDGTPGPDVSQGENPAVTSTDATGYNSDKRYILQSNLRADITIPWVNGLSITGNVSFDKSFEFQKIFGKPWYLYSWDGNPDHKTVKNKRGFDAPQLTENMADGQNITLNGYATYEKTFAEKHNIKVMAGTERRSGKNDVFSAFRKNYISGAIDQLFAGASDQYMSNNGSASQNAYLSYFGRVNYDLSKKYLFEFVWRYDGSYKFPKDKQFGFFPGISAGWRISEEDFWKNNLAFFNDFKIRGSWGQTGNDRIAEYQYLTSYGFLSSYYIFGGVDAKILNETKIPNPNVTWEVANQTNIGFDASLLNNKLTFSADYFNNTRSQILIQRNASIPSSSGLTLPLENIGKVKNSGFEGEIGYHSQAGALDYDLSINGSYSKNKILFWDETPGIPDYQQSTGRPMGSALYYEAIGIFKDQAAVDAYPHWAGAQPGDVIFKDVNGDKIINGLDRVMNEKNNMPRFIGGLTINMGYKQFDLVVLVQGTTGSQQYILASGGLNGNFYKAIADNHWTPENTEPIYPRAYNREMAYYTGQSNTFWLYKMDYVRLKNFELGYSLPLNINTKLGIDGLRFYVNCLNLLTMTKQKFIDPESDNGSSYPLQRIINGGLTLTF